jgi:hypothetical protein
VYLSTNSDDINIWSEDARGAGKATWQALMKLRTLAPDLFSGEPATLEEVDEMLLKLFPGENKVKWTPPWES